MCQNLKILSLLYVGGRLAEAFTNAFVSVKVLEVRAQMEECVECECTSSGPTCGVPLNVSCSRVPGKIEHFMHF